MENTKMNADIQKLQIFLKEIGWTKDFGKLVLDGKSPGIAPEDVEHLESVIHLLPD